MLEIAVSPDRRWLALAGREAVAVWDLLARRQVAEPAGAPLAPIKGVFFAPDGRRLLVSRDEGGAVLVTIEAPRPRAERLAEGTLVTSVAWSADCRELALGTEKGAVRRYDPAASAEIEPPLASGSQPVVGLSFTREGKDLVVIGEDGAITLWDRSSPAPAARPGGKLKGWVRGISGLTFSPDGRDLIAADPSGKLKVWRLLDGREHPAREMGEGKLAEARWSADGSRLAIPKEQGGFRLLTLEATGGVTEAPPYTMGSVVAHTAFSPAGETLAVSDYGGRISLWDLAEKGSLRRSLPARSSFWPSAAWSPDGRRLAWGTEEVALWDVEAGRSLPPLASIGGERKPGTESMISALAFSPDGRTLASGSWEGEIRLWDMSRRTPAGPPLAGPKDPAIALAFTPDGRRLVFRGYESGVALWDLGAKRRTELPSAELIGLLAVSPARPVAALTGGEKKVALVDLDSGKLVKMLQAPAPVYGIAFHPRGDVLATAGEDGAVVLWEVASGERIGAPLAVGPSVVSLSFDRTGGRLAAGSQNGSVAIWDLDRRQRLLPPLAGTPSEVMVVALSPDGTKLVTASSNAPPLLWDLDVATWPARACRIANRNLSREEWRQAFGEETPYRKTCPELPGPGSESGLSAITRDGKLTAK